MRRFLALLVAVIFDVAFGSLAIALMFLGAAALAGNGLDLLMSLLVAGSAVVGLVWLADRFFKIRRRSRQFGRALLGLPEFDQVDAGLTGKSDEALRKESRTHALLLAVLVGVAVTAAAFHFLGVLAGGGVISAIVLFALWVFMNGGLTLIIDAADSRVEDEARLKRDGPDHFR